MVDLDSIFTVDTQFPPNSFVAVTDFRVEPRHVAFVGSKVDIDVCYLFAARSRCFRPRAATKDNAIGRYVACPVGTSEFRVSMSNLGSYVGCIHFDITRVAGFCQQTKLRLSELIYALDYGQT